MIYPPVDIENIKDQISKIKDKKKYYISVNRLVRGKGTEVTVTACSNLGVPLRVVGAGPELNRLKAIAGKNVEFLGEVSDEEKNKLLSEAKALIVASEDEDFGITAVEAQACGIPVIAIKQGGFLETIIVGRTGEFFEPPKSAADYGKYVNQETVDNLAQVLRVFNESRFKAEDCVKNAQRFSKERFKKEILDLIGKNIALDRDKL